MESMGEEQLATKRDLLTYIHTFSEISMEIRILDLLYEYQ